MAIKCDRHCGRNGVSFSLWEESSKVGNFGRNGDRSTFGHAIAFSSAQLSLIRHDLIPSSSSKRNCPLALLFRIKLRKGKI
jgi:hypothetical protein